MIPTIRVFPNPDQYGDVTIDVNLADWGSIESNDIPL